MVKNAADVIFGGLSYWAFGYAFSFGNNEKYVLQNNTFWILPGKSQAIGILCRDVFKPRLYSFIKNKKSGQVVVSIARQEAWELLTIAQNENRSK